MVHRESRFPALNIVMPDRATRTPQHPYLLPSTDVATRWYLIPVYFGPSCPIELKEYKIALCLHLHIFSRLDLTLQRLSRIFIMPGISGTTNGSTAYGEVSAQKIIKEEHKPSAPAQTSEDDLQLVLQNFRLLIADLCQQFGMGQSYLFELDTNSSSLIVKLYRTSRWSDRHGSNRCCAMEIRHEICTAPA